MVFRNRDYKPEDDIREAPPDFFAQQDALHHFTIDACALPSNTKCRLFYALDGLWSVGPDGIARNMRGGCDGLTGRFDKQRVWCNPPFSGFDEWLPWAWRNNAAESITMIAPGVRQDRLWWQKWVEPYRDDQPERRGDYSAPPGPDGINPTPTWRLKTDYVAGRTEFLEDGHRCYQKKKSGEVRLHPKKGTPLISSAMFGLVIMNWSHV